MFSAHTIHSHLLLKHSVLLVILILLKIAENPYLSLLQLEFMCFIACRKQIQTGKASNLTQQKPIGLLSI